ncbi:hypothetical protein F4819DRAFT_406989 [Hypoxylon fuscum]|nr:hypothetical protein F4819DRAFT_406989 [Hypoxylon fuscum]
MPLLLNLPVEVLRHIIEESMPEGFENLMLSCRAVYECGRFLLESHATRKREWRRFSLSRFCIHKSCYRAPVYSISVEPVLARYMETVLPHPFLWFNYNSICGSCRGHTHDPVIEEHIRRSIVESPYLRKAGVDAEKWASEINLMGSNVSTYLWTFYLTLLPNVKVLGLPDYFPHAIQMSQRLPHGYYGRHRGYWTQTWPVIKEIGRRIQENPEDASLGKLTTLRIVGIYSPFGNYKFPIAILSPLLVLPNLTELYARNVVATSYVPHFGSSCWYYRNINSNLRTIELNNSCMDVESISELLAHTPYLVSFKFHYNFFPPSRWLAGPFVAAIGKHVGQHLEELAITMNVRTTSTVTKAVTSMKEFTKLKRLEIDPQVFYSDHMPAEFEGSRPSYRREMIKSIPPFTQILPYCLEELKIYFQSRVESDLISILGRLFRHFTANQPKFPPNMKIYLLYDSRGPPAREVRQYLETKGVICSDYIPTWLSHYSRQELEFANLAGHF